MQVPFQPGSTLPLPRHGATDGNDQGRQQPHDGGPLVGLHLENPDKRVKTGIQHPENKQSPPTEVW